MASVAMSAAVTGAQAQQLRIDTIANNVANVNTDGFKNLFKVFSPTSQQKRVPSFAN